MNKTMCIGLLMAGLALTAHVNAQAQTGVEKRVFLDLNAGVQTGSPSTDVASTIPLFGETASIATRHELGTHPMFDVRLGYRIRPAFGVAFALSGFESEYTGTVAASIPSPVVVGRPTTVSLEAPGLTRRDLGYHLQVVWFAVQSGALSVALSGGPSFVHVQQPVVGVVPVSGAQSVDVAVSKNTGVVVGAHGQLDVNYSFSDRYGAGVFVRYVGGSTDFADFSGVSARAVQTGAGLRIRF